MNKFEKFTLSLGKTFTGGDMSVIGYKFENGERPSTYIQGGTHGGEITYPIFENIVKHLEKTDFKGKITLVPVANPISWTQRLYFYTAGKFSMYDGKDWNWFFPGNPEGTTAQRYADMVFSVAKQHNFVIDLHTSRWSKPFLIIGNEDYLPMAKEMGISHTYLMDLVVAAKAKGVMPLSGAIDEVGVEGFTLECGSHDAMDMKNFEYCSNIVLKAMSLRGHFDFETKQKSEVYYTGLTTYHAPITGFIEYFGNYWDEFKKGDVLGIIHASDDITKTEKIIAKEDCLLAKHQPSHIALIGDQIIQTVPLDKITKF